jgi:hypothetical protein
VSRVPQNQQQLYVVAFSNYFLMLINNVIFIFKQLKDKILKLEFLKALEKTLFHFFRVGVFVCVQKNESVFCALAEKLKNKYVRWQKNKTSLRWLSVQSGVGCCPCYSKNVRSKLVCSKFARWF